MNYVMYNVVVMTIALLILDMFILVFKKLMYFSMTMFNHINLDMFKSKKLHLLEFKKVRK